MRARFERSLICAIGICLSLVGFIPALEAKDPEKLPWEASFAAAREKAIQRKRPLFIMMTATWCGPCKSLEAKTLPSELVQEGLEDFVWVQAFEDKEVEAKYGCRGYPTLAFVDPSSDKVLFSTTGYRPVGPFLKEVIAARKAAGLDLQERLEQLAAKSFTPDFSILKDLTEKGDAAGLKKYLAPVEEDVIRESNYLVGKVIIPENVGMEQVIAPGLTRGVFPDSGLFVTPIPRDLKELPITLIAPGCKSIASPLKVPEDKGVVFKKFELEKLTPKDAIKFVGKVTRPDGKPASNAIVRICDWGVTRTDAEGKFQFDRVSPGEFLVRAEYPGGEFHERMEFGKQKIKKSELKLKPVTTVGLRWAIQSDPTSRRLVGEGVKTGVAYISAEHSRFSLDRGAEVRDYSGSDLMLKDELAGVSQYMTEEQVRKLKQGGDKAPFFWLFDSSGRNGLHLETDGFDSIEEVSEEAAASKRGHFQFLRGDKVEAGAVYTLRTCVNDRYAKLEILSVDPPAQ